MEPAIQSLVKVYLKSSKGKENLSKKDFQNLVKTQLGNILTDTDSNEAINNLAKGLDENQDNKLGFEEYMKLVGWCATQLSEQHSRKEEHVQNSATGQVAQSSPEKEDKAEAKAESKEEATGEVKEASAEAAATVKVEACVPPAVEAKVKAEGEALPKVTEKVTEVAEVVVTTTTTVVEAKEEVKVEEKVKEEAPATKEKKEETTS